MAWQMNHDFEDNSSSNTITNRLALSPMRDICALLNIPHPILQAPMAGGISSAELVAAVSNAGGLGAIAAGYLSCDDLCTRICQVQALTDAPFQVNLFVSPQPQLASDALHAAIHRLGSICYQLNLPLPEPHYLDWQLPQYHDQIEVLLDLKVPITSFTFGIPDILAINNLKQNDVFLIGTATHVLEAMALEHAGMDAIVLQGIEAGGHRATFLGDPLAMGTPLLSLIQQVNAYVNLPLIAAGGLIDGHSISSVLCAGAQAAQLGTALLATDEAGTDPSYKAQLKQSVELDTVLTNQWSGRWGRALRNQFVSQLEQTSGTPAPFPLQHFMTQAIRQYAVEHQQADFMALWAGLGVSFCQQKPVPELISTWVAQIEQRLGTR